MVNQIAEPPSIFPHECNYACQQWGGAQHVSLIYLDESFRDLTPDEIWTNWRVELEEQYGVNRVEGFELAPEAEEREGKVAVLMGWS